MHSRAARPPKTWKLPRGRVLVLAPHPDDETIACGGTILLHRRLGDPVKVVVVTDGAAGDPKGYYRGRDYPDIRKAEARRATKALGVMELEFWDYADGALAGARDLPIRLRELLEREKPDVVYRPSKDDPHPDHRSLAMGFERAASRSQRRFVDCRYEVGFLQKSCAAVDISAVFSRKAAALKLYRSQLRYHDYLAEATRVNVCRSLLLPRAKFAEAFRISRPAGGSPPKISIVIPCRNKGRFLQETLDSVWAQTYRRWELLLVDDGSTDSSAAIARRFALRDPLRIRVLEHPHRSRRGAFASRLLGARRARTPLIALLDADDTWEPDYLRKHILFWEGLKNPSVALSYGPAVLWFPDDPSGANDFAHAMPAASKAVFEPGELLQNFLSSGHNTEPRTSCSLILREALLKLANFDSAARASPAYEDNFLMWGLATRWPVAVHTDALVRYRQRHLLKERPKSFFRRLDRDESTFLPVIRDFIARYHPGHALLGPEGISARMAALKNAGIPTPRGDYFFKRIPDDLRRLSKASP